ncbi:MAG: PilZ domain-containing protein [Deltaproteobacteria bacterium]|nr:PilZ domain-containing protein [Deltaproteobacteria bacterium]
MIAAEKTWSEERTRRQQRAPLDIFLNKIVGDEPFMCRTRNISIGGIYLRSLIEPALEGKEVHLEFALPGSREVIWASGEIVREVGEDGREGSGIRFTAMPERYRTLIAAYVARRRRRRRSLPRAN